MTGAALDGPATALASVGSEGRRAEEDEAAAATGRATAAGGDEPDLYVPPGLMGWVVHGCDAPSGLNCAPAADDDALTPAKRVHEGHASCFARPDWTAVKAQTHVRYRSRRARRCLAFAEGDAPRAGEAGEREEKGGRRRRERLGCLEERRRLLVLVVGLVGEAHLKTTRRLGGGQVGGGKVGAGGRGRWRRHGRDL